MITLRGYQKQILAALNCPIVDVAMIEDIMREDVLGSTLDAISAGEFCTAARQAQALLIRDRDMYEAFYKGGR